MATSGTNYTAKWNLQNGVLTIQPVSGNSGIMRNANKWNADAKLDIYITLTDDEWKSVTEIKFVNNVRFQYDAGFAQVQYVAQKLFTNFFSKASNVTQIDVTGLNITGATKIWGLFALGNLTTITGLANLDVSNCTDFTSMFSGTKIASLDISSFPASVLNNADSVHLMFSDMHYCTSITLPTNFQRTFSTTIFDDPIHSFGIASSRIPATKDGVTISSDEDFFKLTATSQGGTWVRDISGSAELKFNVNKVVRDGNSAEMQYTYYASSATAEVYLKETNQSSFPSTPSDTFNIEGTGTGSRTLTLASDSAYDVMVKVYDGETTLYTYPSIDSNVLLFSVDEDGVCALYPTRDGVSGSNSMLIGAIPVERDTSPSAAEYYSIMKINDLLGNRLAYMDLIHQTVNNKDAEGFRIFKTRDVNGSTVYNGITLSIDDDGGRRVSVSDPSTWRTAIGLSNLMVTEAKSLGSVEMPANSVRSVSASVAKSGYTPLGIVGITKTGSNQGDAIVSTFNVSGTTATVSLRNQGSATRTPSVTAKILYIKTL